MIYHLLGYESITLTWRSRMDAALNTSTELAVLSSFLDLDEFEVLDSTKDRARQLGTFTLVPKIVVGLCPHCQGISEERHLCRDRTVMDLPMVGWRTELVVRLWQFRCQRCDHFFTPHFAALAEGSHATERLLERLAELVDQSDISSAARFFGLAEKTAQEWYYQHAKRKECRPRASLQPVRSLGIDELSLKKDTGNSAAC
jgi:transposase